jgi:hypothetical protein
MALYRISPYVTFIENRLFPGVIQYGVSHRLTGEVLEPDETVRALLLGLQTGNSISLDEETLNSSDQAAAQLRQLIEKEFLISDGYDPLSPFANQLVARPIQNPAVTYKSAEGEIWLVQTSMAQHVFSPRAGDLPEIIEEKISPLAANVFKLADGSRTLQEIFTLLGRVGEITDDSEFRESLEFLTSQQRQLIKFTSRADDLDDPYSPVNIVPRDLYHSSKWQGEPSNGSSESVIDFHESGIEDAWWEFDQIEPTVNHSFRFASESLGGLDYGSRFCVSTLQPEIVPALLLSDRLEILEVGGGTGTFARSFIQQSATLSATAPKALQLNYHILDLSPTLIENQRRLLSEVLPPNRHFQQDATKFDIPGKKFDLIVSNEVVADFPMAAVERHVAGEPSDNGQKWQGNGVYYLEKYNLQTAGAPQNFLLNAGTFEFIERCWKHLFPGGTLILSEYGGPHTFPVQSFHLNHAEFSIHFGHLVECGKKVGFKCRLLALKDFLALDDEIQALTGREEHILCLNHVLRKYGKSIPYAVVSKTEFKEQFQEIINERELTGFSFLPLRNGHHFGPRIDQFMVLIMNKPL